MLTIMTEVALEGCQAASVVPVAVPDRGQSRQGGRADHISR
ncbi:MAG: hypothetical protein ACLQGV_10450 [Bryobacteraceae bacterium]